MDWILQRLKTLLILAQVTINFKKVIPPPLIHLPTFLLKTIKPF